MTAIIKALLWEGACGIVKKKNEGDLKGKSEAGNRKDEGVAIQI
jgi:hypothetical protein